VPGVGSDRNLSVWHRSPHFPPRLASTTALIHFARDLPRVPRQRISAGDNESMTLALQEQLSRIGACQGAVEWAGKYETLREAWAACARGDWMFSLCGQMIGKEGWPTHQAIVLAACDCAELALPSYEQRYPADPRVRVCLAITRQWAAGNATIEAVKVAAHAAAHAADAAYRARLILPPPPSSRLRNRRSLRSLRSRLPRSRRSRRCSPRSHLRSIRSRRCSPRSRPRSLRSRRRSPRSRRRSPRSRQRSRRSRCNSC
jgi:hypothetical protein